MGFWNPSSSSESSRSRTSRRSHSERERRSSKPSGYNFFPNTSSTNSSRGYSSRARPRSGFVARVRRFLAQVYEYMKKNPAKVFFLVIMPLITGGALTKLLSTVGLRLPPGLERLVGSNRGGMVSESERFYARGGARDFGGGSALPGMGGGIGESIGGLMGLAKMFI